MCEGEFNPNSYVQFGFSITGNVQVMRSGDQKGFAPCGPEGKLGPPPHHENPPRIGMLNVTRISVVDGETFVAPFAGVMETTDGVFGSAAGVGGAGGAGGGVVFCEGTGADAVAGV